MATLDKLQLSWVSSVGMHCLVYGIAVDRARAAAENTHKLMGFYMEVLILGVIL